MLLRSASTPVLNSWFSQSKDHLASPDSSTDHQIPKSRSVSIVKLSSNSSSSSDDSCKGMTRAFSESNLREISRLNKPPMSKSSGNLPPAIDLREDRRVSSVSRSESLDRILSFGSLDEGSAFAARESQLSSNAVGGGSGGGGRRIGGGGGGGSGGGNKDGSSEYWDSNHGNACTDAYYQKMIAANPGNEMVLCNYARYLKEVKGEFSKAEKCCEKAILANPDDGNVLAFYADLVWQNHRDAQRAERYFERASKAAPNDCFVAAAYAGFLWEAEEDDEEEDCETNDEPSNTFMSPPSFFEGAPPPITATS